MLKTRAVHTAGERPLHIILQKNIYTYINFWSLSLFLLSLCGDSFHFPDTLQLKFPSREVNLLLNLMSILCPKHCIHIVVWMYLLSQVKY